jgi:hypothetical protein
VVSGFFRVFFVRIRVAVAVFLVPSVLQEWNGTKKNSNRNDTKKTPKKPDLTAPPRGL